MSEALWYKFKPQAFNDAVDGMSLEETGAYIMLLNAMYIRGGALKDHYPMARKTLGCSARTWMKLRAALLVHGKLFEVSINGVPHIFNETAAQTILVRQDRIDALKQIGSEGGKKSSEKRNKNNEAAQAYATADAQAKPEREVEQVLKQGPSVCSTDKIREDKIPPVVPQGGPPLTGDEQAADAKPSRRKPKRPIPDDFPDAEAVAEQQKAARSVGADIDIAAVAKRFRNWAIGADHRYSDWSRTWENWCLGDIAKAPKKPSLAVVVDNGPDDEVWRHRMRLWAKSRFWRDMEWGGRPGRPDCEVPKLVMDEFSPPQGGLFGEMS